MEIIEEKIQVIAKEIQEANATPWTITKIIKALNEMNTNSEKKLREKTLIMLKELDPEAAVIYERFSKMKVHNSKERVEGFNRGHIITSLLKETNISRSVAEKITLEVENQIKDSKIEFLTTSLIRELVNARLIAYGFEDIRHNYTRLGEPAYEIKKRIETEPCSGEGLREYNLTLVLPKNARELHFSGAIHIEDIEGYSHRPYAHTFVAEKKESLEKTILYNLKTLVDNRKYFFLPPNIYGLTFACAPFVKSPQSAKKAAELILEALQIPEKGFTTSVELFTSKALEGFEEYKIPAAQIGDNLLGKIEASVGIDSKYCLKLLNTEKKSFTIINNSTNEYYPMNNKLFCETKTLGLMVNINLEKIAQDNSLDTFFIKLEEICAEIKNLEKQKKQLLGSKKYLSLFEIKEMKTGIGLTNILRAAENFEGIKAADFATKVYKELAKTFDEEMLFSCTEGARQRFEDIMGKKIEAHEVFGFEDCLSSKKCCFSGKAASPEELEILLGKKVKQIEFIG